MFKQGDKVHIKKGGLPCPSWNPIRERIGTVTRVREYGYVEVDYGIPLMKNCPHWAVPTGALELVGHFMCHVEGLRGPSVVHDTVELATAEAKRLAEKERGKDVYVLKAVAVVKAEKPLLPEAVVKTL